MAAPRMTPDDWAEARRLFEADGWDLKTIASYFGINYNTAFACRKREDWKEPETRQGAAHHVQRKKRIQQLAARGIEEEVARVVAPAFDTLLGDEREEALVEANAMEVTRVAKLHREGATKARTLVSRLFDELELSCIPGDVLDRMAELVAKVETADMDNPRAQARAEAATIQAFRDLLGLAGRADVMKKLVDSMVRMVELERKVYGIKDDVTEGDIARALKELAGDE